MSAAGAVVVQEGSPPICVNNLFFKSYCDVVLPHSVNGLLDRSTNCLECSSKFGTLLIAGQESLLIVRGDELVSIQSKAANEHHKQIQLGGHIPHVKVQNASFGSAPCIITIAIKEEYVAVDTIRDGVPFVLIFKLDRFLSQGGRAPPHCEIRASSQGGSKVTGITWNPGDNMNNMVAIICDDGSLQLATVKGENSVEMCSYKAGGVKSMCWSPKGKQLVVGKVDGTLCQLKLDLNEAKKIPGPGGPRVPTSIFWSTTTQFIVAYIAGERDIDFMQLDLVKGAPPVYTNFGDIFVSDRVDSVSKSFFVPILPWNVMICPSNTINDVIVLGKGLQPGTENWAIADLNDNRRAAIPIDNFAVGATLFSGYEPEVFFNESETYTSMPILFVLSQAGTLSSFSFINSDSNVSVFQKVANLLPPQLFSMSNTQQENVASLPKISPEIIDNKVLSQPQPQATSALSFPIQNPESESVPPNPSLFSSHSSTMKTMPTLNFGSPNFTGFGINTTPTNVSTSGQATTSVPIVPVPPSNEIKSQSNMMGSGDTTNQPQFQSLFDLKSLPTTGLPSLQQVEDLKRIVEEKRAQGGLFADGDNVDGAEYEAMQLELEKFQKRLEMLHRNHHTARQKTLARFDEVRKNFEEEVLTGLQIMEDFVAAVNETTDTQNAEVGELKEKVLSHFTELEYAKALGARNNDPTYMQLLQAQPMDAGRIKKFQDTENLYHYAKNQLNECDRFFNINNRQPQPLQGAQVVQVIYQTLANHSRIIKKLAQELNKIRAQLGLGKCIDENMRLFEVPSMGHNYYEKKPLLKERSASYPSRHSLPKVKSERLTMDDLTAGLSRVKLNKEREAGLSLFNLTQQKPLKISAKKLEILTKAVSNTVDIQVENDDNYVDPFDLSVKNRVKSRLLISKLDDKTLPKSISKLNVDSGGGDGHKEAFKIESQKVGQPPSKGEIPKAASTTSVGAGTKDAPSLFLSTRSSLPVLSQMMTAPSGSLFGSNTPTPVAPAPGSGIGTSAAQPQTLGSSTSLSSSVPNSTPLVAPKGTILSGLLEAKPAPSTSSGQSSNLTMATTKSSTFVLPEMKGFSSGSLFGFNATPSSVESGLPTSTAAAPRMTNPFGLGQGMGSLTVSTTAVSSTVTFAAPTCTSIFAVSPASTFAVPASASTLFSSPSSSPAVGFGSSSPFGASTSPKPAQKVEVSSKPVSNTFGIEAVKEEKNYVHPFDTTVESQSPQVISNLDDTTLPINLSQLSVEKAKGDGDAPAEGLRIAPKPEIPKSDSTTSIEVRDVPNLTTLTTRSTMPALSQIMTASSGSLFGFNASAPTATPAAQPLGNSASISPVSEQKGTTLAPKDTILSGLLGPQPTTSTVADQISNLNLTSTTTTQSTTFALPEMKPLAFSSGSLFGNTTSAPLPSVSGSSAPTAVAPSITNPFGLGLGSQTVPSTSTSTAVPLNTTYVVPASKSIFAAPAATLVGSAPSPIFAAPASTATSVAPASSSIFAAPTSTSTVSPASSIFAMPAPTSTSTFDGMTSLTSGLFGDSSANTTQTGFSSPTPTSPSTGFGPVFGSPTTPKPAEFGSAPVFGGTPAFGSTSSFGETPSFRIPASPSTFGSAFGSSGTSAGSASPFSGGGSIFGGGSTTTQQSAPSFGALAQTPPPQQGFGSFGSSAPNQASSVFGGGSAQSSTFGGSTGFGPQAATTAPTGSIFGSPPSGGLFSGRSGSTAQSGFSFASPASTAASGFGSPSVFGAPATAKPAAFGSAPVFGGTPAFGSTPGFGGSAAFGTPGSPSTFGSAFGSSVDTTGGASFAGGGSIFGGGVGQQTTTSFGALAQTAPPPQQGFGAFGSAPAQPGNIFGGGQPASVFGQQPQQQQSLFGGTAQPQSATPGFGGSAFSSWR